jgi:hypothetical protein
MESLHLIALLAAVLASTIVIIGLELLVRSTRWQRFRAFIWEKLSAPFRR